MEGGSRDGDLGPSVCTAAAGLWLQGPAAAQSWETHVHTHTHILASPHVCPHALKATSPRWGQSLGPVATQPHHLDTGSTLRFAGGERSRDLPCGWL